MLHSFIFRFQKQVFRSGFSHESTTIAIILIFRLNIIVIIAIATYLFGFLFLFLLLTIRHHRQFSP